MLRAGGASSTLRLLDLEDSQFGILDHPPSRVMTVHWSATYQPLPLIPSHHAHVPDISL